MRFVCEDCGESYEVAAPYANIAATSDRPLVADQPSGSSAKVHRCRRRRRGDDEPGSLFDKR